MRWLLFLSRLAFVLNIFFLVEFLIQWSRINPNRELEITYIFIWFFLLVLFNPAVNLCYFILFFTNKHKLSVVPLWLRIANFLFLLLLIFYIFLLNVK